jgi:hypothetical protein
MHISSYIWIRNGPQHSIRNRPGMGQSGRNEPDLTGSYLVRTVLGSVRRSVLLLQHHTPHAPGALSPTPCAGAATTPRGPASSRPPRRRRQPRRDGKRRPLPHPPQQADPRTLCREWCIFGAFRVCFLSHRLLAIDFH